MFFYLVVSWAFIFNNAQAQMPLSLSPNEATTIQLTDANKIRHNPTKKDDLATENILNSLIETAGWFPELTLHVNKGLVIIEGKIQSEDHLKWLVETAGRLPSVITVVNKVEVTESPVWDFTPAKKELNRLLESAKKRLPIWGLGAVLFLIFGFAGRLLSHLAKRFWKNHIENSFLVSVVSFITLIPIYAILLYLTLATLGLSGLASTIIGGTGLLGIVLGFAFKGIAENFLSGMLLAIRSPFSKGDFIVVGNYSGTVQNLNMRGTTIMDLDGNLILIPNALIITSVVQNNTANPKTRYSFYVGIGYSDSLDEAISIIRTALKKIPEILSEPEPIVVAENLTPATVNINIYYWIDALKFNPLIVKSNAVNEVKCALLEYCITMPDEAREVILIKAPSITAPKGSTSTLPNKPTPIVENIESTHDKAIERMSETAHLPGDEKSGDLLKPAKST
jgi:small conductance mechanosensitive channel